MKRFTLDEINALTHNGFTERKTASGRCFYLESLCDIGIVICHYKTGNVSYSAIDGETVAHYKAQQMELYTKPVISIYGDIGGCINPYNPYGKRVEELFIRRINEIIPGFADGNWGEECPEMVETRVPYRDYKKHLEGKPGLLTVEGTYNTRRKSIVVRWDRDAMEYINELRMHASDT